MEDFIFSTPNIVILIPLIYFLLRLVEGVVTNILANILTSRVENIITETKQKVYKNTSVIKTKIDVLSINRRLKQLKADYDRLEVSSVLIKDSRRLIAYFATNVSHSLSYFLIGALVSTTIPSVLIIYVLVNLTADLFSPLIGAIVKAVLIVLFIFSSIASLVSFRRSMNLMSNTFAIMGLCNVFLEYEQDVHDELLEKRKEEVVVIETKLTEARSYITRLGSGGK